jgi:outer membrane protein TolC
MKAIRLCFIFILGISLCSNAQKEIRFSSVDSLFKYAEKNSATTRTAEKQVLLARSTKIAAIGNTVNLKVPLSASYTDNTELPVNYLPAEIFGGPPGTVKELAFGQEFVSTYAITPQLDLINVSSWNKVRTASINEELIETNNLISKKALFENIALSYYTIISLQEQVEALKSSEIAADSIVHISDRKFSEGLIREQEKNNALINSLSVHDKALQLQLQLEQSYNTLKLLCDIQQDVTVTVTAETAPLSPGPAAASSLIEKQQALQAAYLKSELRSNRLLLFAPTVSLVFNQAWQENSNTQFFDSRASKFSTQYYGIRLSVPFPLDAVRLSQSYASKINYKMAQITEEHALLQNKANNRQLELNYQAALSSYTTATQVSQLKNSNYIKSMNQYKEGILSTENLLTAFTDEINAKLISINAHASLSNAATKIKINNSIQ